MSKKEKDVELIPDTTKASGWKIKHDGKEGSNPNQGGPDPFPILRYDVNSGAHLIVFTLPKSGPNKFNKDEPIWIQKTSSTNPTSPTQSGMAPDFSDWALFDGDKTLVVLNKNKDEATYSYRVAPDGPAKVLDPIVDNGGGVGMVDPPGIAPGGGYSQSEYITVAAIALLVGVLIGYFVHKMFFGPKPVG